MILRGVGIVGCDDVGLMVGRRERDGRLLYCTCESTNHGFNMFDLHVPFTLRFVVKCLS
jgi:hypothetical protein